MAKANPRSHWRSRISRNFAAIFVLVAGLAPTLLAGDWLRRAEQGQMRQGLERFAVGRANSIKQEFIHGAGTLYALKGLLTVGGERGSPIPVYAWASRIARFESDAFKASARRNVAADFRIRGLKGAEAASPTGDGTEILFPITYQAKGHRPDGDRPVRAVHPRRSPHPNQGNGP